MTALIGCCQNAMALSRSSFFTQFLRVVVFGPCCALALALSFDFGALLRCQPGHDLVRDGRAPLCSVVVVLSQRPSLTSSG